MRSDTLVSVVAPIQDDGPILREFVAETIGVLADHYAHYELVLVDDDSTDETARLIDPLLREYPCLRLIRLSRRFGADVAVTAGLDASIGDFVVVMRPQADPPALIPDLVCEAEAGHGVVLGTSPREAGRGPLVWLARRAFYGLIRRLLPSAPPSDATGFCALSRPVVNAITRIKSRHRHLGFLSCSVGHAATLHPYRQIARSARKPIRPLRDAVGEAIAIFVTNSFAPLRLVSYLGAFAGLVNLAYVGYIILVNLIKQRVAEGWTTLSLQMSFMFFFIFLNLTIISEYVAHIMQESQDRPLYHVLDERTSTVRVNDPERRNVA